jgi:hypothetical protein
VLDERMLSEYDSGSIGGSSSGAAMAGGDGRGGDAVGKMLAERARDGAKDR